MSLYSFALRASFKISDTMRDRGLHDPAGIAHYDDLAYGPDPRWQTLDVYRPECAGSSLLPVIVSVHGGGWVYGDKNLYRPCGAGLQRGGMRILQALYKRKGTPL